MVVKKDIAYDIAYDVVYDVVCDVIYDILCCPPVLTVGWQDTLALVAPYPFRVEPLEDFDPLTDFDMTGSRLRGAETLKRRREAGAVRPAE